MEMLVGDTGFVGSNLCVLHKFDELYNSKNIEDSYGKCPDLLVYSGVPSQKFLANKLPEKDYEIITNAINNIKNINPKQIILISTIDVYKNPINVNEDTTVDTEGLEPYGYNRFLLEEWIKNNIKDYLIVRLPGLYGKNIKKNFIYDLIHIIPIILTEEKYFELLNTDDLIKNYYKREDNGFYRLSELNLQEEKILKNYFNKIGFSALNFTDNRGKFQFYNLKYLWRHIEKAKKNNIRVLNLATEPVLIEELYRYINNKTFKNEITDKIPNYNFKTKYDKLFNGNNGYIYDKKFILQDIKEFVRSGDLK